MSEARTHLRILLTQVPAVYDDLEGALLPGRGSGEPSRGGSDPLNRPAPANLEVTEHRHKLVRGLRWWVDAVRESGEHTRVGHDVTLMCAWLLAHLQVMAPEDHDELRDNLAGWLSKAEGHRDYSGQDVDVWAYLSAEAVPTGMEDQRVRVADAARILGCTVRTIQRRVPAEARPNGRVRLGDAMPRCTHCDLIVGQCEHTRATVPA